MEFQQKIICNRCCHLHDTIKRIINTKISSNNL